MTELDIRHNDQAPAVQPASAPAVRQQVAAGTNGLIEWAQQADVAYQMAEKLAATSFVPATLRGKPADIAAAILAGQELGLKPMATLKSIDVIQGTPALRAHAMRGLLQSHGHDIELVESDDQHCVMRGRRAGTDNWQQVTWTLARAEKLQLLGKSEWKKQPTTMLIARATGEICRLVASDALYAMPHASEELDAGNVTVTQITRAPLSVAELTATPQRATPAPAASSGDFTDGEAIGDWRSDDALASHEWDVPTLAATLGLTDADLDERCHRLTGAPLATASAEQIRTLTHSLASEMVALDNAQQ